VVSAFGEQILLSHAHAMIIPGNKTPEARSSYSANAALRALSRNSGATTFDVWAADQAGCGSVGTQLTVKELHVGDPT
jgi:hypothetical protein